MRKYYIFAFLITVNLILAQNFHDTKGELSVSGSGTASYKVPIALPPGIKDIAPQLSLIYSGSSVQGMAGMGWNLIGISSISRNTSRLDLDKNIDPVDFDNLDRFTLDGQRLIEKVGNYGAAGTTYQTENYSNLKIGSTGNFAYTGLTSPSGPQSFTVTFPDGTQAFYGNTVDSRGLTEWMINRWIDPQGNYIDYTYETETNVTRIKKISWGKNTNSASTFENKIDFTYKARIRTEYSHLNGLKIASSKVLSFITVSTGGQKFKTYTLEHELISGNYQRVKSITESNGSDEKANPIIFDYINTSEGFGTFSYFNSSTSNLLNNVRVSGDFDGDGNVDFATNDKVYVNPVGNNNVWTGIDFPIGFKNYFTATTLTSNKLNQFHSIVKVTQTVNSISFNVYNLSSNVFALNYTKTISFDNSIAHDASLDTFTDVSYMGGPPQIPVVTYPSQKDSNEYFEGDFNGDGISETLIKSTINEQCYSEAWGGDITYNWDDNGVMYEVPNSGYSILTKPDNNRDFFLVNLDPNASITLGSSGYMKLQNKAVLQGDKYIVMDFNADGKTDILVVNKDKTYKVVGFKQLTVAPWIEAELMYQGTFAEYDVDKQLVFGDFNGDSKADIMIPEANDSSNWFLYQATGSSFERIAYPNFELYQPYWHGAPTANRTRIRNYRAADLNKDGKSDFIINEYESWCVDLSSNGCDRNARGRFRYKQNIGSLTTQPVFAANVETYVDSDYGYDDQINLLIGDFRNQQANFNFVFIQGTQIWKGSFNKDLSLEATLTKVTEAGGGITQSISYKPLVPSSGLGSVNDLYHSSNSQTYPYTELIRLPTMNIVDKITATGAGQTKSQLFKYFGLITHSRGLGVLGFKKIARSSWYTDASQTKIWSCQQMNPQLNGVKLYEWTYSGDVHTSFTNPPILTPGASDLGITTNSYTSSNLANGVKIIVPNKSEKKDFLTGLTSKTEFFYDTYWNVNRTLFTNAVGTKETILTFFDNINGSGKEYALGRITQSNKKAIAYGDTFSTEEKFTYHPTATNLVQQSQKKGNLTDYITTDYTYDAFGNVTQKTISAPNVSARTIKNKYDANGRFVTEKTDHEGFISTLEYNLLGQVTKNTNYLGVISSTNYDNWGKISQNAVTGVSSSVQISTVTYSRFSDGGFSVTTSNPFTGEVSRSFQDVFGRNIKCTTKGFAANSWISKSTEYSFLGQKIRESEPYFDSTPTAPSGSGTKWNTVTYDYLGRITQQLSYNGRTQSITYSGLNTTTTEGPKTTKITIDANSNKTQLIDNTETLSYTYYASGLLKETIYGNHKITLKYDGWGNKIYMMDPSINNLTAYTYSYNNYGEMLTENTPKGTTTITYSPTGKISKKISAGQNTTLENNYFYNAKGLLTSETGTNNLKAFSYSYIFNSLWQLTSKTEVTPNLTNLKTFTYDSQGRILQECTNSYLTGITSVNNGNKTIEYGYNSYNGILEQFKDIPSNVILWKLNTANEKMQILTATLGNGMQITNAYDSYDYIKNINHTVGTNVALNLEYQFKADRGTLNYRKNTISGVLSWNETFTYDSFERLTSWTDPTGTAANTYETDGRIKTNDLVGTYNYDPANRYRKTSADLNDKGNSLYATRSSQTVVYNMFKNPTEVTETSRGKVNFEFNLDNERSKTIVLAESGTVSKNKYYSGISSVEVIEKPNKTLQFITYIGGSPYDAMVALEKTYVINGSAYTPSTEEFVYLHRDYQGTILAISGNGGVLKERRQFDPWGILKKHYKGNVETAATTIGSVDFELLTDRGYTGHEHFFSVGIIHMNGRIYDPVLRTFLSPDPIIQDPSNSQNYNRYAYVLNNPLLYTDPSGNFAFLGYVGYAAYIAAAAVGAIIGGIAYSGVALYSGTFSWGGLAKSILVGAASGVISAGIGEIINSASAAICTLNPALTDAQINLMLMVPQAALHGISQGFIQGISGGNMSQTFLTAAISSIAAGGYGMLGGVTQTGVGQALFGTVAGGITAQLQGGNFWEGAAVGLTVSWLNHVVHKIDIEIKENLMLDEAIRKGGYGKILDDDPYLNWSNDLIREFALKVFPELFSSANNPIFEKQLFLDDNADGKALFERSSLNGKYTVKSLGKILLKNSVLNSVRQLASVIGHELNHMTDYVNGSYANWINQYGLIKGRAFSEVKAYGWEKSMDSSSFNPVMYNYFLDLTK
jgi:RHS repeat-associated protein